MQITDHSNDPFVSALFHKDGDFIAFEKVLGQGLERYPVDLLIYCLMGNHWHMVLRPSTEKSLSDLMRWVGVTHVRRHHEHYHSRGSWRNGLFLARRVGPLW